MAFSFNLVAPFPTSFFQPFQYVLQLLNTHTYTKLIIYFLFVIIFFAPLFDFLLICEV